MFEYVSVLHAYFSGLCPSPRLQPSRPTVSFLSALLTYTRTRARAQTNRKQSASLP